MVKVNVGSALYLLFEVYIYVITLVSIHILYYYELL